MVSYLIERIFQSVAVLLLMSVLVFVGVYHIGDPTALLIPPTATEAEHARAVQSLGLDQPLWRQYLTFLANALRGDLGNSFVLNAPAIPLLMSRLPATLELVALAMLISIVVGIPLGIYVGLRPASPAARSIVAGSILGFCLPSFWVGLMLIMIFSVYLGWLPSSGRGETAGVLGMRLSFVTVDGMKHLILPAVTLSLYRIALLIRLTRANVQEAIPQDYVKYARAKGVFPRRIVWVHVLRNALIPIVTVLGLELGATIALAVVIESIFAWPGVGKLVIDSIAMLDRPIIVAYVAVTVALVLLINLVVDIVSAALDPRVRLRRSAP